MMLFRALFVSGLLMSGVAGAEEARRSMLTGLNLAGAEFGDVGGEFGKAYRYPGDDEIADVARRGFTIIRLPFLWERLQPALSGPFDKNELARLTHVIDAARAKKLAIILNPHNYARWKDDVIGSTNVPVAAFADFWRRLAAIGNGRDGVIFGLMNEPHDMPTQDWARAAQAAIDAIRATGACNRILVPGNAWSGAHSWLSDSYGTPNAVAMAAIKDPIDKASFEFHQYLDADWSGRSATCRPPLEVVDALAVATRWLEERKATGFLGEIGAGNDPQCLAGLSAMLDHMDAHAHVWRGWTAWAAGAWWPKDYPLLLRATDGRDPPALALFTARRAVPDPAFVSASCGVKTRRQR